MHRRFLTERPCRSEQPGMSIIDLRVRGQRVAWVQVEWNVEALEGLPERPVGRQIIVKQDIAIVCLTESVDESPFEVELGHATFELADGQIRVLHGQSREGAETIRPLRNLCSENVVRVPSKLVRQAWVGNGLNRWRVEGEDHPLHTVPVHEAQTLVLNIDEPALQFRPVVRWHEGGGIYERFFDGEVFFECNLSRNDRHHWQTRITG